MSGAAGLEERKTLSLRSYEDYEEMCGELRVWRWSGMFLRRREDTPMTFLSHHEPPLKTYHKKSKFREGGKYHKKSKFREGGRETQKI